MLTKITRNYVTNNNIFTLTTRAKKQIERIAYHHQTKDLKITVSGSTVFGYRYKIKPITTDSKKYLDYIKQENFNLYLCETSVMNLWNSKIDWYHRDTEEDSSELNGEGFIDC